MKSKIIAAVCLFMATLGFTGNQLSANDCGCDWLNCDNLFCCDECHDPYGACTWNVSLFGSVDPIFFEDRGRNYHFVNGTGTEFTSPVRRFDDLFDTPWDVGFEVGYLVCDRVELFFDFDYVQASGKKFNFPIVGTTVDSRLGDFNSYNYYVGTRFYFPTLWCMFTPFVGGKFGFNTRGSNNERHTRLSDSLEGHARRFRSETVAAGGFQLGVNWDITKCLAFTVKVEALLAGELAPRALIDDPLTGTSTIFGRTGPVLSVPVSFGLRYSF